MTTFEHFIIGPPIPGTDILMTACGIKVSAFPLPPVGTPRCPACIRIASFEGVRR